MNKLREDIFKHDTSEGLWQAILNIGYDEWQRRPKEDNWDYPDMLQWVEQNYGKFARFCIQLGKYNQQVTNGGHYQYYENGYASKETGFMVKHGDDLSNHEILVELFEEFFGDIDHPMYKEVLDILQSLTVRLGSDEEVEVTCNTCDGAGVVEDSDYDWDSHDWDTDEEPEDLTCPDCDGEGYIMEINEDFGYVCNDWEWKELDRRYFEVSDLFVENVEHQIQQRILEEKQDAKNC